MLSPPQTERLRCESGWVLGALGWVSARKATALPSWGSSPVERENDSSGTQHNKKEMKTVMSEANRLIRSLDKVAKESLCFKQLSCHNQMPDWVASASGIYLSQFWTMIKVAADSVFGESSLPGWEMAAFLPCPQMAFL